MLQNAANLNSDLRPTGLVPAIRSRIQEAEKALADLRTQLGVDTAGKVQEPARIAKVQRVLLADEALILIEQSAAQTYIWGISANRPVSFAVAEVGRTDISATVNRLRRALAPENVTKAGDIPPFDTVLAHDLCTASFWSPCTRHGRAQKRYSSLRTVNWPHCPLTLLPTSSVEIRGETDALLFAEYRDIPGWYAKGLSHNCRPFGHFFHSVRLCALPVNMPLPALVTPFSPTLPGLRPRP